MHGVTATAAAAAATGRVLGGRSGTSAAHYRMQPLCVALRVHAGHSCLGLHRIVVECRAALGVHPAHEAFPVAVAVVSAEKRARYRGTFCVSSIRISTVCVMKNTTGN